MNLKERSLTTSNKFSIKIHKFMCGISGFAGRGSWKDIYGMTQALYHRGPDEEGYWADKDAGVYLGHRRLSIIDLFGGKQPMWSKNGQLGIIFNGEIYNHIELRKALIKKGHVFQTDHSDTEVLLHGYRQWRNELPHHLNGMWAFAIIDRSLKTIFLSRDRFGKKPLYYTHQNSTFAFASEINSLKYHASLQMDFSTIALQKYFAYGYIPAPLSLYKNIFKLPAGYNLELSLRDLTFSLHKYWDFVLDPFEKIDSNSEETWCEQIRELLKKSIKRRLVSDVPVGFLLSGGIDSSIIATYGAQFSNQKISTFTVGFNETSFDEAAYADQIARTLKTKHHLKTLSLQTLKTIIPQIIHKLDEPIGDGSLIPTYLLCQEVQKSVKVALSGDGADELFAGYDTYRALRWAELYNRIMPDKIHQGIRMIFARMPVSYNNISLDFKINRTLQGLNFDKKLWNPVWLGPLLQQEIIELFQEPVALEELYSEAIETWEACTQTNIIDKSLQFYTKLYLQNGILVKIDRASMMNSLELRSPFLDIDLVNLVRRIPFQFKLKNGQTKYILKKALDLILPHNILYRPKKGFGMPISQWFKEGSLSIKESKSVLQMNTEFILQKQTNHLQGKANYHQFLWSYWLLSQMLAPQNI